MLLTLFSRLKEIGSEFRMSLPDQSSSELSKGWISKYLRWCPTSSERLEEAERRLLAYLKKPFQSKFVTIDSILKCKGSHQIRTIEMGPTNEPPPGEERVPLVLVHGFASGVALWLLNLDKLSEDRTVYSFDTLGFGRSSRPRLSSDSLEAEYQFVQSPLLVEKIRADIGKKYEHIVQDSEAVPRYIYHCNAQFPSGESAFKAMMTQYGWAKHPMVNRIAELHVGVPMTFIYGSKSWVDKQPGIQVQQVREESEVDVEIIEGAGHHVFADRPDQFNDMVCKLCRNTDAAERIIRALTENEDDEKADEKNLASSAKLLRSKVFL